MNSMVKVGLIAGGAYVVAKYVFGIDPLAGLFGATTAVPQVATSPQASNPNAAIQANTKALVIAAAAAGSPPAAANSYQTMDVWNYFYAQVRGIPGPDPATLGATQGKLYSVDEWWNAMTGAGFSGLGYIAHHVNPYHNWQGTPYGDNLLANGMEKYIIRVN